jgi:hypothetical protein
LPDFIEDYKNEILSHIPTNPNWAEDIAISLLSTFCANIRTETKMGRILLATHYITIAPSSAVKSLPLREYLHPILDWIRDSSGNVDTNYRVPTGFTPESLTLWFSGGRIGRRVLLPHQTHGIIIRDEVSTLFKETSGKGYNVRLQEFLSDLFEGYIEPRFTISHEFNRGINDCHISFIGATTPFLYNVLEREIFIQGLGSRIMWEIFDTKYFETKEEDLIIDGDGKDMEHSLKDLTIKKYSAILTNIARFTNIVVKVKPKTEESAYLTRIKNSFGSKADEINKQNAESLDALYISKSFVKVWKLAALKVISRTYSEWKGRKVDDKIELFIESEDVEWSNQRVLRYISNFDRMLKDWTAKPIYKPVESEKNYYDAVIDSIECLPGKLATRLEIVTKTGIYWKKLKDILDELRNNGQIEFLCGIYVEELGDKMLKTHSINSEKQLPTIYRIKEIHP